MSRVGLYPHDGLYPEPSVINYNNKYPYWWNTTLTIYNQYSDPVTEVVTWFRTVVNNCFWKYSGERVLINDVELNTSTIICRIPEDTRYRSKYLWEQLPNDEMGKCFTVGRDDIIIPGEVEDDVDEYGRGLGIKSTDLLAKYAKLQGCMKVNTVVENIGGGRNNPHYYVSGDRG